MRENEKVSIVIRDGCPLVIQDQEYCKEYDQVTIEQGGYIEILVDCAFKIDKLIYIGDDENPSIILRGRDGKIGKPGENGETGGEGGIGEIIIDDLQSDIKVQVYGGGKGGKGGRGGDGGNGGDGAHGASGGDGGNGGDGCNGGKGGSGGMLTITYKTENESSITGEEMSASGGLPGAAGKGGSGGTGKHHGRSGRDGREGKSGNEGQRGQFILNRI